MISTEVHLFNSCDFLFYLQKKKKKSSHQNAFSPCEIMPHKSLFVISRKSKNSSVRDVTTESVFFIVIHNHLSRTEF